MRIKLGICFLLGTMLFLGSFTSSQAGAGGPSFSLEFGSSGTDDGEFNFPSGLALDTGANLLYVIDSDNDRIQIIDVDGSCSGNDELADDICFCR